MICAWSISDPVFTDNHQLQPPSIMHRYHGQKSHYLASDIAYHCTLVTQ